MKKIPKLCPKSANPYTYCPLVFKDQDEMILNHVISLVLDLKRHYRMKDWDQLDGYEARLVDIHGAKITAYMNGRIHELIKIIKRLERKAKI